MIGDASATWTPETQTSPYGLDGMYANAADAVTPGMGDTVATYIAQGASIADALTAAITHFQLTAAQLDAARGLAQNARRGVVPYVAPSRSFMGLDASQMQWLLLGGAALATLYFLKGDKRGAR